MEKNRNILIRCCLLSLLLLVLVVIMWPVTLWPLPPFHSPNQLLGSSMHWPFWWPTDFHQAEGRNSTGVPPVELVGCEIPPVEYCWWKKSGDHHLGWCWNPINNGKNYLLVSTGAGFQPSTVLTSLKLTWHLKMDGWNTFSFPFGMAYFQVLKC